MISSEERFRFDLESYLVVKNALAPEEVTGMNRIADRIHPEATEQQLRLMAEPFVSRRPDRIETES